MVDTYGHYIDGAWVDADGGRYDVCNPATEQVIATAPEAGVATVERAIAAARAASARAAPPLADVGSD